MGTVTKVKPKKPQPPKQALPGRRIWMTRGLRPEHHARLRKIAAFMPRIPPESGTVQGAHDLVLEAGLPIIEARLGIPDGLPPAA